MSKATTKATIDANIKQNGTQAITGQILNSVLNTMVDDYATQEEVDSLASKTSEISKEEGETEEAISIVDNNNNLIHSIDSSGANFKNLKSNGQAVITDISGKQDKIEELSKDNNGSNIDSVIELYTDDNTKVTSVKAEISNEIADEQIYSNDAGTEDFVKIGSYGIKAKAFLNLDGTPISGGGGGNNAFSFLNNSVGEELFANGLKDNIKILGYGNSFMRNSVHFLSALAHGCGINAIVGNLYTGGTQLSNHVAALRNDTNPYEWYKYVDGVNTVSQTGQKATRGLLDERWDVIILHQYQPWLEPFQPYLNELIDLIVEKLGYCPKFYINATWAGILPSLPEATKYYGYTSEMEMLEAIWQYNIGASESSGVKGIIPTGTAIQNARTLSWADSYNRFWNLGSSSAPDLHHLNAAGGFVAAATIFEKIVYPLKKIHCSATTFRIPTAIAMPPQSIVEQGIIVTDSNYLPLCNSAIKAVEKPFEVSLI